MTLRTTRIPFNDKQIESMNGFQSSGVFHPFTCGNDSNHANLVATKDGWICIDCDYTQDWAHDWMTDESWKRASIAQRKEL